MRRIVALVFVSTLIVSCSSSSTDGTSTDGTTTTLTVSPDPTVPDTASPDTAPDTAPDTTAPATTVGGNPTLARPFDVFAPSTYNAETAMPLVVLLHGFGATGDIQEAYFQLQPLAESRGFLYVHPNGTINPIGRQFWNATDACCGFGAATDDSAYLTALIEKVQAEFNVDPKRIFLVGHSNGGFMSYRMACDHADTIAAIASLAGATFLDTESCDPSEPVSVLQLHGTADETIEFGGGALFGNAYPAAPQSVATWAEYNGCATTTVDTPNALDLEANIAGAETSTAVYEGCPVGIGVELRTIEGAGHIPIRTPEMSAGIIDFLFAHAKP